MKAAIPPFVHSFPAPAVVIGCGTVTEPNLITCSWFGTVCSEPPTVSVSVRRSRFSHRLIEFRREFTVNIPRTSDLEIVKFCGSVSGMNTNKFADLGLTPKTCPPLKNAPMIDEFFMVLACRVVDIRTLGSHDMFIGEVVGVHCDEDCYKTEGRPDMLPHRQVVYLNGKYWTLTPAE